MSDLKLLVGKVCLITGAGKGIGRATALLFAHHGARLALASRTEEDLKTLEDELGLAPEDVLILTGDVSEPAFVERMTQDVLMQFGRIDVLINNAGIRFRKAFLDITLEEWNSVQQVNAGSVFLLCQAAGRVMLAQRSGKIVNMVSVVGTLGLPELVGYAASKGAIISLTKALAVEWAEACINVNAIAPGFCETSYTEAFKKKQALYQFTLDRTPMKRWGSGQEVANACLYLASTLSDYVTGEILNVDGGWSAW
jgi:NAD(P)-dependent dehydrogenase (short-subunit alcohol dehydrogenase family)